MKKILISAFFLFIAICSMAQIINKEIASKVSSVIVYMNAAQITHNADATLGKGDYNLVFPGISPNINQKSIQVTANNDVKVTSVTYIVDYMDPKAESATIQNLKDSLKLLDEKVKTIDDQLEVYKDEKALVLKNNDLKGTMGVVSTELQKAADFMRSRLNEINTITEKLEKQQEGLNERSAKIQKQLTELNSKQGQPVYKLNVTVSVKAATTSQFTIKYLVTNAGWSVFYDIRATDVNSPIQLDYKAKVFNNCGIDWSNVQLTLSTADPTQSAQRPSLSTWGLNYNTNTVNYVDGIKTKVAEEGYLNNAASPKAVSQYSSNEIEVSDKSKKQWNNQYTTIEVSELSVDFEITSKYSLPSDNKVYFVDVQTEELPATYKYIAIPKIDKDAFLVANITGWESLNLIEGNANIFYAGTFVGQSYINTRFASDTLEISLGRDKKVAITRTKKVDNSGKTFISGNYKETLSYEITVRNNNQSPINIEIQDQIPVSQESDIKVDAIETSGATPDPLSGKLVYELKLNPSESKILINTFTVQYPKAKAGQVNLRKSRTINCPTF